MPLVKLVAEGVGPFERLELDLSDGKGNPHLGPHILAGVNGSGKSTVLRAIAWVLDRGRWGFDHDQWKHLLTGHPNSRALIIIHDPAHPPYVVACQRALRDDEAISDLKVWVASELSATVMDDTWPWWDQGTQWIRADLERGETSPASGTVGIAAAYAPAIRLSHLTSPDLGKANENYSSTSMGFSTTVQNEAIQAWLLSLYSKRVIARERQQASERYTLSLDRLDRALRLIYDEDIHFEVEIEPRFEPRFRIRNRSLNFSQLPDGVKATVGWIADFMMRQDAAPWDATLEGRKPGILLLDEVDAHLHPLWQRRLLPALREALPDVQTIVSSHSPFVISSCPGSRVHVLEVDERGRAHNRRPVDAPVGESVLTTLKGIFGVDSRFDILTERDLDKWNDLKRDEVAGKITNANRKRLIELTQVLSERSEELRSIVAGPTTIPESVLNALLKR
jgi:hypothetical protein